MNQYLIKLNGSLYNPKNVAGILDNKVVSLDDRNLNEKQSNPAYIEYAPIFVNEKYCAYCYNKIDGDQCASCGAYYGDDW